ncbi:MAG: hypothetical protein NT103_09780 [Campylobacterales bacterium]|nr:hypothetical protein [Campylobacterales bacterium]
MKKPSNQDIEKYYFEMFRKDYPLPLGTVIYGDAPDVIIDGESIIGIEITNFYHKSGALSESEQVQSGRREQVVSTTQNLYQKQNGKKFEISFGFDKSYPIKDQKILVNQLIHLATQIQNSETGEICRGTFKHIPELSFVYLNNKNYKDTKWRVVQVHDVPMLVVEQLVDIVKTKEHRSKKYKKCDVYWLLIVVDYMNPAQDQEIQVDAFKKIETDVFERVIVYKTIFGQVLVAK